MAPSKMDGLEFIGKHLMAPEGVDTVKELLKAFAERLMSADADAHCSAEYGARSDERTNQRSMSPPVTIWL